MVMLALLPVGSAAAQEHTVHRNIGLDSVMVLMQRCSREKIYYQSDASQGNLTFTVNTASATLFEDIKGDLEANGYKVLPMKGYLFVLKGVGLAQQLPADYFLSRKKQADVQVEKDYIDALAGRMDVATSMNKTYQIGDKDNVSRSGKAYLSGYVRDAVTGEPVVGVSLVDQATKAYAMSDVHGFYKILLPVGKSVLDVAGFSLEDTKVHLQVYNDGALDVVVKEKVFALTGKIRRGGLVEVPMGLTLRDVIYDIGGGVRDGGRFKAVQMGGPSGGCIPESLLDTQIDYKALGATGAIMGSGGMVVMDDRTCMVNMARFFLDFTAKESCGKCVHCRIGTKRLHETLVRITEGKGCEGDVELLEELCTGIKDGALCGLGQTAPNPVLTTIRYFRDEYDAHIREKRCPAHECAALRTFAIDPAKCKGCTLCSKKCPVGAISGSVKVPHVIDAAKCIKCGACAEACRFGSVLL